MSDTDRFRSGQFNLKNVFAQLLRFGLGLGALVFLVVTLIGLLGAIDGEYDVVNHFRIFIVLPGLCVAGLALLMRSRVPAIFAACGLIIHGISLGPEVYAALRPTPETEGFQRIKVVTFNVANRFVDPGRFRRFIEREVPDVLVVQEAWGDGARAVMEVSDLLPHNAHCMNVRYCNVAILSRFPVLASTVHPQSPEGVMRFVTAKLSLNGMREPSDTVTVVNTHLSWPVPHKRQERQFRKLVQIVSGADHERMILAGDFNSTPWSHAMQRFDAAVPLDRVTRALSSWPAPVSIAGVEIPYPLLPIDHVLVGAKIEREAVRRGPFLGSDHYPVIAELVVRE